jgi:hypothetical protein
MNSAGNYSGIKVFREKDGTLVGFMPIGEALNFMNPEGREEDNPQHHDDFYFFIEDARLANLFGREMEDGDCWDVCGEDHLIELIDRGIPISSLFEQLPVFAIDVDSGYRSCNCPMCRTQSVNGKKAGGKIKRGSKFTSEKSKSSVRQQYYIGWQKGYIGYI